jgi:uncharacterized lipoprotein YmbA
MHLIMKRGLFFFFLAGSVFIVGCQNSEDTKSTEETIISKMDGPADIKGTWTLTDELHKDGKNVVWEGRPTVPEMTFKENGYFLFVDRITDEEMKSEGIASIQDRYKGQYDLKGKTLTLNHYEADSLITRKFQIEKLNATELVINDKNHGHTMIFKR